MNEHTANAMTEISTVISVCAGFIAFFYFVVVIWWSGWIEASHKEEILRHETCYQEWSYNEPHKERWLRVDYCTHKN